MKYANDTSGYKMQTRATFGCALLSQFHVLVGRLGATVAEW